MTLNKDVIRLRLHSLLGDDSLVDQYIKQFGPVLNTRFIAQIKNSHKPAETKPGASLNEPVFALKLRCPVCGRSNIDGYELRAKSQIVTLNKLQVPTYEGTHGFGTEQYLLHNVTVCPNCLFASPDKKDFFHPESLKEHKSQINGNIVLTLQDKTAERKSLLKVTENLADYFKRPRSFAASIDSYRLAMARAKVEEWYETPYASYKLGSYALRIAHLLDTQKTDSVKIYQEALLNFETAFKSSNCPLEEIEMQTIYLIIGLAIKCNDQAKANSYISVFSQLRVKRQEEMTKNADLTFTTIDKWYDKAKALWEDRDDPELFTRAY